MVAAGKSWEAQDWTYEKPKNAGVFGAFELAFHFLLYLVVAATVSPLCSFCCLNAFAEASLPRVIPLIFFVVRCISREECALGPYGDRGLWGLPRDSGVLLR